MAESWWTVVLLAVALKCLLVLTITFVVVARDLRRTTQRLNTILPHLDRVTQEASRTFGEARQFLVRTNHMTQRVEVVVDRACEVASDAIEQFLSLRERTRAFLVKRLAGNGARVGPRRHS